MPPGAATRTEDAAPTEMIRPSRMSDRAPPSLDRRSHRLQALHLALLAAVALAVLTSRVRDTASDGRATLAISQTLVRHGTFELSSLGRDAIQDYGYRIDQVDGRFFSHFPLGTSLLAAPIVLVLDRLGADFRDYEQERLGQVLLAALVALGNVSLLVRIARFFLGPGWSLAVAAAGWFGTAFASVQATALWSHNLATLLALFAIERTLAATRARSPAPFVALGLALFGAYLCRPTLSLLTPALLGYLALHQRRQALLAAAVVLGAVLVFVVVSQLTLGAPLPNYYLPQRLSGSHYLPALVGNLVSPGRGLLIFAPIFLVPLLFARHTRSALGEHRGLVLVALVWPLAHILLVSRLQHWWGGYSYGPRLLTDILPGLFVLLCVALSDAAKQRFRAARTALIALGALSFGINTLQGLYNPAVKRWNVEPNIDQHPELLFDWRYPQFLHTPGRHADRLATLARETAPRP
jgi:hypothetical protein